MALFLRRAFSSNPAVACALLLALNACGGGGSGPSDQVPTQLQKLSGDEQIGIAGQTLAAPLVIEVDDANGNPVRGVVVTFAVSQGGGSIGTATATTATDGTASTTFTTGPIAGAPQQVAASVATASITALFTATTTAGPPASITIAAGNNQQVPAGTPVPTPPAVVLRDANGNPVAGVAVTFEVVSGGGSITGESAVTGNDGNAEVGSWILGGTGPNLLRATAGGVGITGNPLTFAATAGASPFDIVVRFLGSATPAQRQAFADAQARWEGLITGDQEDVHLAADAGDCGPNSPAVNETVDDLLILASIVTIDGPGGVLASAGPCFIRNSNQLSVLGAMRFDSEDLEDIEAAGLLPDVILHEMGHVLGFGSLWPLQDFLADPIASGGTDPHFTGAQAIAAFNEVGGGAYAGNKVPVEDTGDEGTVDGHWRESVMGDELMTGFVDPDQNPLSKVTIASLADQGYVVNLAGADPYSLSLSLRASGSRPRLPLGKDLLRLPIKRVDSGGRVMGLFQR
jgi:hypothetical protein